MNRQERRRARRSRGYRSPEGRRHPKMYRAVDLIGMLVADGIAGHATDLEWAVGAYDEIARQRHGRGLSDAQLSPHLEEAFTEVRLKVEAAGKRMPIATGPIR